MIHRASALPLALLMCAAGAAADDLRVMSFNIRYLNQRDGANRWEYRRGMVASIVRFHRIDVLGVQEAMAAQMDDLHRALPEFESFGSGRDGRAGGERSSLFFDRRRIEKIQGETFWLSPTPDRPSRAWGASLRRICTWGEFRMKGSDRSFFVFNTHFDHRSAHAREESARLLVQRIGAIAGGQPAVLMGDLNCGELDEPYRVLTKGLVGAEADPGRALWDARMWTARDHGPSGTFSGWDPRSRGARIDYIFVKNDVHIVEHGVIAHGWNGRAASDHRPVLAALQLHAPFLPEAINLNHVWRFRPDPEKRGHELGFHRVDCDDGDWKILEVGEPWESQGFPDLDGDAYFRKRIFVPATWKGRAVKLVTPGIADAFTLFVNGAAVHTAGSASESVWTQPIILPIASSAIRFGADNALSFRVTDTGGWGGFVGYPMYLTIE